MAIESLLRLLKEAHLERPRQAIVVDAEPGREGIGFDDGNESTLLAAPLDPLENGLFLTEDFARLDIGDVVAVAAWFLSRGSVRIDPGSEGGALTALRDLVEMEHQSVTREAPGAYEVKPRGDFPPWATFGEVLRSGGHVESLDDIRLHAEMVKEVLSVLAGLRPGNVTDLRENADVLRLLHLAADSAISAIGLTWDPTSQDPTGVWMTWESALQPIYVQLLMAFRRITRGRRGAARCRECGLPFLILDGRRSTYCNTTCRNRYNVRAFRSRAKRGASDER
jgi:hypothetical protein